MSLAPGRYHAPMTDPDAAALDLRTALIDGLRAARSAERDVLGALGADDRLTPAPDGGWSPKDIQAHLSAWKRHQAERFAARREGREEPASPAVETDEANAILHAERADWTWEHVVADADTTTDDLVRELELASTETLGDERIVQSTLGNGPEHIFAHLPPLAERAGMTDRIVALATDLEASVARGGWPIRAAAYARYNLACYHALGGRLDEARTLLRLALPVQEDLRTLAPVDDDLVALRDEIPTLSRG